MSVACSGLGSCWRRRRGRVAVGLGFDGRRRPSCWPSHQPASPSIASAAAGGGQGAPSGCLHLVPANLDFAQRFSFPLDSPDMHPPLHKPSTEAGPSCFVLHGLRRKSPCQPPGGSRSNTDLELTLSLPRCLRLSLPGRHCRPRGLPRAMEEVGWRLQHGEDQRQRLPARRGACSRAVLLLLAPLELLTTRLTPSLLRLAPASVSPVPRRIAKRPVKRRSCATPRLPPSSRTSMARATPLSRRAPARALPFKCDPTSTLLPARHEAMSRSTGMPQLRPPASGRRPSHARLHSVHARLHSSLARTPPKLPLSGRAAPIPHSSNRTHTHHSPARLISPALHLLYGSCRIPHRMRSYLTRWKVLIHLRTRSGTELTQQDPGRCPRPARKESSTCMTPPALPGRSRSRTSPRL